MLFILIIVISLLVGLTVAFLFFGINRLANRSDENEKVAAVIEAITRSEIEVERVDANAPEAKSWSGYWYNLFVSAGRKPDNNSVPGLIAIGVPILFFLIGFLVWPGDLIGGVAGLGGSLILLRLFLRTLSNRRMRQLDSQLPTLLSGLRASLQANQTPQQAIIIQANEISGPLGEELKTVKNELSVGMPLDTALQNFSTRVPSRETKFLIAAMRIAITSGTDLDPLLSTIQQIVVQRAQIANQLATAVASVQPSILVAGVMIPAAMLFSYYSSESNKEFWNSPLGLIIGAIVAVFYAAGLFIAKKQVDRVKEA